MVKYFCECCGKEMKEYGTEFKVEVGHFYATKDDICGKCRNIIEKDVKEVLKKYGMNG